MLVLNGTAAIGQTILVDTNAPGTNDGSSWENAYIYLQDALSTAQSGDEIWVAQGIYKPDQGVGIAPGSRGSSFHLISGAGIYGGFPSGGGSWEERDPNEYETILSGQLDGTNSYHVVIATDTDSTAIIDGFTITGGKANGSDGNDDGGGMYGIGDSGSATPTVINCIFKNNYARYDGGGVVGCRGRFINCAFVENVAERFGGGANGSATFINCAFIRNRVIEHCTSCGAGGGGLASAGTLINCIFIGNRAEDEGGGLSCSTANLTNCIFIGNSAGSTGGAIKNGWTGSRITNCTFVGNSASSGGAIYCFNYSPKITNSILWDNQGGEIRGSTGSLDATYSNIKGGIAGIGNINEDPLFLDADGEDDIFGTEDDNPRLSPGSPCTDAGNNNDAPLDSLDLDNDGDVNESLPFDLEGNPRFADDPHTSDTGNGAPPIVDMGAYEGPHQGFRLSSRSVTIGEGATETFTVALGIDPLGTVEVTSAHKSGDNDIIVQSGSSLSFNSSNYWVPQTVTLAAGEDGDYLDGSAIIQVSSTGFISAEVSASEAENDSIPAILYVDATATGGKSGTSWANAFNELREALDNQAGFPEIVKEIYVAEGIYKPAEPYGDRQATFKLTSGLALYGGFQSGGGRYNPGSYETILSGDLNGDDVGSLDDASRNENCYHVVTTSGTDANTVLDGLIITGGNANGSNPKDDGGGLYNSSGEPTVNNCIFFGNRAKGVGGGMYSSGSARISDCSFEDNVANDDGGGLLCKGGPTIDDCKFLFNLAKDNGGGIANGGASIIRNCIFVRNRSYDCGGGIHNSGSLILTNCSFFGNLADDFGGAFFNPAESHPILTNCIFSGNMAVRRGGAIDNNYHAAPRITNCSFSGNASARGGAIYLHYSRDIISNSIFWGNWDNSGTGQSGQIKGPGLAQINYCCVQGWTGSLGGLGNFGSDPLFDDSDGDDDIVGTEDDKLNILLGSSCIDAGDSNSVPIDTGDIDNDSNTLEVTPLDFLGNPRFVDERYTNDAGNPGAEGFPVVDVGAYEYQVHYVIVDNFNNYEDDVALHNLWKDGGHPENDTLSAISLENDPYYVVDSNSILFVYDNDTPGHKPKYSEIRAEANDLEVGSDWTVNSVKALRIYFYGQSTNSAEPLYFAVEDINDVIGVTTYEDTNSIQEEEWHEWNIDLNVFANSGVSLDSGKTVYLGIGIWNDTSTRDGTGSGQVWFDEIRLWRPWCVPEDAISSFNDDCTTDCDDLLIFSEEWLTPGLNADLTDDGHVDFADFAIFAKYWQQETLWP
jgi:predicted outer membrane repeat protein